MLDLPRCVSTRFAVVDFYSVRGAGIPWAGLAVCAVLLIVQILGHVVRDLILRDPLLRPEAEREGDSSKGDPASGSAADTGSPIQPVSEKAWWRRLDGQPSWKEGSRAYGSREVLIYRICYLLLPFVCLSVAWTLQDWYILFLSPFVLLNLFVILPRHHRRQVLGRPPD